MITIKNGDRTKILKVTVKKNNKISDPVFVGRKGDKDDKLIFNNIKTRRDRIIIFNSAKIVDSNEEDYTINHREVLEFPIPGGLFTVMAIQIQASKIFTSSNRQMSMDN